MDWHCLGCFKTNSSKISRCKHCSTDKPWSCPKCDVKNQFTKKKCGNCSTAKPALTGWICGKCGIYNFKTLKLCTMCEQRHNHVSNKQKYDTDTTVPIRKQTKTTEKETMQKNAKKIAEQKENFIQEYEKKLRQLEKNYERECQILDEKFEKEKKILKSELQKSLDKVE
jgi:hypothetical protein